MSFNSYIFILGFLPCIMVLYFISNKYKKYILGNMFLILASFVFIACNNIFSLAVLIISITINYVLSIKIMNGAKKISLIAAVSFNVIMLAGFKYADVLIDGIGICSEGNIVSNVIMPLGISFYTFQQIAYLVDCYRGEVVSCKFIEYILFVSYFPKILQGPMPYHNELIQQFRDKEKKSFSYENFSKGIWMFAVGLTKKVMLADNLGKIVDYGYLHIGGISGFESVLTILAYTLQLYFDFSGYCDMAMGISGMFNIELPVNFDSPYKSKNISEFWKRWHITLTRFLTKYIYIPLGGNRKGKLHTYINILIVFIISGLWHGAGYSFLVWGILHGVASILYRISQKEYDRLPNIIQYIINFVFLNIAWCFFRAPDCGKALDMLKGVVVGGWDDY